MSEIHKNILSFHKKTEDIFSNCIKSSDSMVAKINEINSIFDKSFSLFNSGDSALISFFLHRSRSLFLSSVRIGGGGQSPDVYPLLRTMLECALYAWYINQEPSRINIWFERIRNTDARKRMRKEFTLAAILNELEKVDAAMFKVVKETYEFHIDFGAHPNVSSVISGMRMKEENGSTLVDCPLIHSLEMGSYHLALKEIASAAIGVLAIFRSMYPEKFKREGLDFKIRDVMIGL